MRNHKENGNGSEMGESTKSLAKMEPENNNKISVVSVSKLLLKDSNGANSRSSNSNASFSSASVAGSVQVSLSIFFQLLFFFSSNRFWFSFLWPSDFLFLLFLLINPQKRAEFQSHTVWVTAPKEPASFGQKMKQKWRLQQKSTKIEKQQNKNKWNEMKWTKPKNPRTVVLMSGNFDFRYSDHCRFLIELWAWPPFALPNPGRFRFRYSISTSLCPPSIHIHSVSLSRA